MRTRLGASPDERAGGQVDDAFGAAVDPSPNPAGCDPSPTIVRGRPWPWGERTLLMGVVNVTPDSFSGDGLLAAADPVAAAVALAAAMVDDGADLLDVGGESTRPGGAAVSEAEELARVVPVVAALRRAVDVPISIDTSKAAVAEAAIAAGADIVNDVWALTADGRMAGVVARAGVPVILMHNRLAKAATSATVGGHYADVRYDDVVAEVRRVLAMRAAAARAAGIAPEQIILDPGLGFGKTPAQNLALLDRVGEVRALGWPVLVGPSRKSFVGAALDLPPGDRVEGTAAAVAVAITRGADIVRVHDVRVMARVARMTDAIVRPTAPDRPSATSSSR